MIPLAAWRAAVDLQRHINTIKEPHMSTPTINDAALNGVLGDIPTRTARTIAARLISKADAADAAAKEAEEAAAKAREEAAKRAELTKPGTFLVAEDGTGFYVEGEARIWRLQAAALYGSLNYWESTGYVLKPVQRSYEGNRLGIHNESVAWKSPTPRAFYASSWD